MQYVIYLTHWTSVSLQNFYHQNATLSVIVWAIEKHNLLDEANIQMQTYIRINTIGGAFTWRICYRNKIYR